MTKYSFNSTLVRLKQGQGAGADWEADVSIPHWCD